MRLKASCGLFGVRILTDKILHPPHNSNLRPHAMHAINDFGFNDFIEYWAAFRLFIGQENPYDPDRMLALQRPLGWTAPSPLMMWNPPWLLLFLWPILCWDFPTAASIWFAVNTIFVLSIILFSLDLVKPYRIARSAQLLSIPLALTFLPLYESLRVGQLGAFLGFVFSGAIWSILKRKRLLASLFLAFWSIKIHLFIPLGALLLLRSSNDRTLRQTILLAGVVLGGMALATELIHPDAITQWLGGVRGTTVNVHVEAVDQWIAATLTGGVRLALFEWTGHAPRWPMTIIPAIGVTIAFGIWWKNRTIACLLQDVTLMSFVGLVFAPFGWLFDFTLLLPSYLLATLTAYNSMTVCRKSRGVVRVMLGCQALGMYQYAGSGFTAYHHFMWMPVVMGVGFWWCSRNCRKFMHLGGVFFATCECDLLRSPKKF
jgi:hypothetical protein